MTQENFSNYGFAAGMQCTYKGKQYYIVAVDFEERLIGIDEQISGAEPDAISWKRCESVEIVPTMPTFILAQ